MFWWAFLWLWLMYSIACSNSMKVRPWWKLIVTSYESPTSSKILIVEVKQVNVSVGPISIGFQKSITDIFMKKQLVFNLSNKWSTTKSCNIAPMCLLKEFICDTEISSDLSNTCRRRPLALLALAYSLVDNWWYNLLLLLVNDFCHTLGLFILHSFNTSTNMCSIYYYFTNFQHQTRLDGVKISKTAFDIANCWNPELQRESDPDTDTYFLWKRIGSLSATPDGIMLQARGETSWQDMLKRYPSPTYYVTFSGSQMGSNRFSRHYFVVKVKGLG